MLLSIAINQRHKPKSEASPAADACFGVGGGNGEPEKNCISEARREWPSITTAFAAQILAYGVLEEDTRGSICQSKAE